MDFSFKNIHSSDFGVQIVYDNRIIEETFLADKTVSTHQNRHNNKSVIRSVEHEPLSFPLMLKVESRDSVRTIKNWLSSDTFMPFRMESKGNKLVYAMFHGTTEIHHNGGDVAILFTNVLTNSPYSFGELNTMKVTSSLDSPSSIRILNDGDLSIKPLIRIIKMMSDGDVTIKNYTTKQHATHTNLLYLEVLTMYNEYEELHSSYDGAWAGTGITSRYHTFNDEWITLATGENIIEIIGDVEIEIDYQDTYLGY